MPLLVKAVKQSICALQKLHGIVFLQFKSGSCHFNVCFYVPGVLFCYYYPKQDTRKLNIAFKSQFHWGDYANQPRTPARTLMHLLIYAGLLYSFDGALPQIFSRFALIPFARLWHLCLWHLRLKNQTLKAITCRHLTCPTKVNVISPRPAENIKLFTHRSKATFTVTKA